MEEVLTLEGVEGPALEALAADFGMRHAARLEDVADGRDEIRALIVRNRTQVDATTLERLPRLEVVGRAGVGLDNIDVAAMSEAGVVVTFAPGENADSTAEHTLALALAAAHRVAELDRDVRAGGWNRRVGRELAGDVWGVVGFGRIGRRVAGLARGIGMSVLAADPLLDAAADEVGVESATLDRVLREALVVSVHVPLTDSSRGLIGAAELASMRADAILVNTARGGIVDEAALAAALNDGTIAGAALDVREQEPPVGPDALAALDQVVLTPHVAALTHEAQARVIARVAGDVHAILSGGEAERPANFARPRPRPTGTADAVA
jgi:D-3-phosphoglycerate dehydrogenase